MTTLEIPVLSLVVLIGASGSGKSTFAARHFRSTEILSSDRCRAMVADDPDSQAATTDAFDVLFFVAGKRLASGLLTVVDATSVRADDRAKLVALAKEHDVLPVAITLDLPTPDLLARAETREHRTVRPDVVRRQQSQLRKSRAGLRREGFRHVFHLDGIDAVDDARVVRTRLFNDRTDLHGPFDIIGDVHGCADELVALLTRLGWSPVRDRADRVVEVRPPAPGRTALFVGDLVDRGPDTPSVLRMVMAMVAAGDAICVRGNHEEKLLKALRAKRRNGSGIGEDPETARTPGRGLAESLSQLETQPAEFIDATMEFLDSLVSHHVFDDGGLVLAHAGLAARYHGRTSRRVRELSMYGETTGRRDRWGFPVRRDWARDYRGTAAVVYGHVAVPETTWVNNTICLDTGCVYGGRLTALRYPERELVSVDAVDVHWPSPRPTGYGNSAADSLRRSMLDFSDVSGKRVLSTRFGPPITIREENAAAAVEVMSRFAIDARWLRYLPPTMTPAGSHDASLLEDATAAIASYREHGVSSVVLQEKHMGSRAIVVVARDPAAAARLFGVHDSTGAIHSRTGRAFFDRPTTEALLTRIRAACSTVFAELSTDWLMLDAELLPWNVVARPLITSHFASVSAAGIPETTAWAAELEAAARRGLDVGGERQRADAERSALNAYTDAYLRHLEPSATTADVRFAPFEVLAAQGRTFADKPPLWHLQMADHLVSADPDLFVSTGRFRVATDSAAEAADATSWWTDITVSGAEGAVVKPEVDAERGRSLGVVPGLKVRGPEYLRIVYGPSYLGDIERLRSRDLRHKRSMAQREHRLGREALALHVEGAPLWRIHEFVFGVLALESEPVDPRL